ncbi:MAG: hypothetical protein WCG87_08530 [Bacteroidota bacterium]
MLVHLPIPSAITASVLIVAFVATQRSVIKDDARQVAELQCRTEYLMHQQQNSLNAHDNLITMSRYASNMSADMQKKYTTEFERNIFMNAYSETLSDCRGQKETGCKLTTKWRSWYAGLGDSWNELRK